VQGTEITDMDDPGSIYKQHYILRSRDFSYVLCNNGEEELYDVKADPYEWNNIANNPDFEEKKRLTTWLMVQLNRNNQDK